MVRSGGKPRRSPGASASGGGLIEEAQGRAERFLAIVLNEGLKE